MPKQFIISAQIQKDVKTVWETYNQPKHIMKWNAASFDWHSPAARSDFREGGQFNYRMEAKDGSEGFDFTGTFDIIDTFELIKYHMDDQREVVIKFTAKGEETHVEVVVDAEETFPIEFQKRGWQSILNNFKRYVESF